MNTPTPLGKKSYVEYEKQLKEFKLSADKINLSVVGDLSDNVDKIQALSKEAQSMYGSINKEVNRVTKELKSYKSKFEADEKKIEKILQSIQDVSDDSQIALDAAEDAARDLDLKPDAIPNFATLDIEVGDIDGNYADLKDLLLSIEQLSVNL